MDVDTAFRRRLSSGALGLGLCACAFASVVLGFDRVFEPLTLFLTACALAATLTALPIGGRSLVSGSFVCSIFAVAVLGAVPGMVVATAAEAGASLRDRVDGFVAANNLFAVALPTLLAGTLLETAWGSDPRGGGAFLILLTGAAVLALLANLVIHSMIPSFHTGVRTGESLAALRRYLPVFALGILLTVATTAVYQDVGSAAAGAVVVVVIAFNYTAGLLLTARTERTRATKLADDRQDLVVFALDTEDRERRLLAERLHDGPMQTLLSVRQDLESDATPDPSVHLAAVGDCLRQLRRAVHDLHPAVMRHSGLSAAIESVASGEAERGGFKADIHVATEPAPPQDQLLFSVARELLRNVATHAHARQVEVRLDADEDRLRLSVVDDGDGIDLEAASRALARGHIGLASSMQRVEAVGGRLSVSRREPRGTQVEVEVPVVAPAT